MFSFVGDVVLDPFSGTGTTSIASIATGRNSIGYEIDPHYRSPSVSSEIRSFGSSGIIVGKT
jgi:DNA modification methylase